MRRIEAALRTRRGPCQLFCWEPPQPGEQADVALVFGEVQGCEEVTVRIQSECLTGHVFESVICDCHGQLHDALDLIATEGRGVLVYLRQEGRGIGLVGKLDSYALQAQGLDTVDANAALGYAADARDYGAAARILDELGVTSVRLLTNNPDKSAALRTAGVVVSGVIPLPPKVAPENQRYLATKRDRLGHKLDRDTIVEPANNVGS
jgi:3,4-dihydroxy 2-butanone 4-phosphate synthase / GTP cyclohydrolase II